MIQLQLLALCLLCCSGPVLGCDWDGSTDPNQGLDPSSTPRYLGRVPNVSDPEGCRAACCQNPECDLVLVGLPADGAAQCVLVSCWARGHDACTLQPSTQFQVFRKRAGPKDEGVLRVVPLLETHQTRTNDTNNGKQEPGSGSEPGPDRVPNRLHGDRR